MLPRLTMLLCAASCVSGCARPDNDRLELGGPGSLQTLSLFGAPAPMEPSSNPTLNGAGRGGWPELVVLAPLDASGPTGGCLCRARVDNARHQGVFPAAQTALDERPTPWFARTPRAWDRFPAGDGAP